MNEQKSLLGYFVEAYDRYRAERRAASSQGAPSQPGRLGRLVRWLLPNGGTLILIALLIATQNVWARQLAAPAAPGPSATTVNYQGRLADSSGTPLNGTYGMSFALYDALTGGNLVWGPENHTAVPVSNGLFSVGLGSQTAGGIPTSAWNGDRYLGITVGGETLAPRELIRSVPIAGMALTVPDGAIGTAQIADGAVTSDKVRLQSGTVGSTAMTLSESWQNVATTTIVADANMIVIAYAIFDFSTDSGAAIGTLAVDGVRSGLQAIHLYNGRGTDGQVYRFTIGPGTHTLALQARKFGSAGSAALSDHTVLVWFAFAQ